MKRCARFVIATTLLASTAALAQPYKCSRHDRNCQTLLSPALPPQPLAPQAGYDPGRPHKCLRYDWTCQGKPNAPVPLVSDFAPHGVEGRQHLENSPTAPTEPPPAVKQWR